MAEEMQGRAGKGRKCHLKETSRGGGVKRIGCGANKKKGGTEVGGGGGK